ncbi:MAG: class II aldolase/adducin family protein [Firmicutes bacterium]|nr:class II aldolase/adducin family protein [Bacillota bacterium]
MLLQELRREVVSYCRLMSQTGLVKLTSGNISVRDPETRLIAVTPTSLSYDAMTPADVVVVNAEGSVVEGDRRPTVRSCGGTVTALLDEEAERILSTYHAATPGRRPV